MPRQPKVVVGDLTDEQIRKFKAVVKARGLEPKNRDYHIRVFDVPPEHQFDASELLKAVNRVLGKYLLSTYDSHPTVR